MAEGFVSKRVSSLRSSRSPIDWKWSSRICGGVFPGDRGPRRCFWEDRVEPRDGFRVPIVAPMSCSKRAWPVASKPNWAARVFW